MQNLFMDTHRIVIPTKNTNLFELMNLVAITMLSSSGLINLVMITTLSSSGYTRNWLQLLSWVVVDTNKCGCDYNAE